MKEKSDFYFFLFFSLLLSVFFLASCAPEEVIENNGNKLVEENNHIHAIAFDPTEAGKMYVATHYYLEKIDLEKKEKERLGKYGDDYMGFVIAGDGTFYASGHSPEVANVGIRRSTDKGKTWETLAYEGKDFHDITAGYFQSETVYAWSTPPDEFLTVSLDSGKSWEKIIPKGLPGEIFTLTIKDIPPQMLSTPTLSSRTLYSGTLYGVYTSFDDGKTWKVDLSVEEVPIIAMDAHFSHTSLLTIVTPEKILRKTLEGKWQDITNDFNQKEKVIIFLITDPATGTIYGVTKHGEVYFFEGDNENEKEVKNLKWEEFKLG